MKRIASYLTGLLIFAALATLFTVPRGLPAEATPKTAERDNPAASLQSAPTPTVAPRQSVRVVQNNPLKETARPEAGAASTSDYLLREEERTLQPSLHTLGQDFDAEAFSEIEFPLFDDRSIRLTSLRHTVISGTSGVFTGRVADDPGSHVVLSYVGLSESGTIHHPAAGAYFDIRAGKNGASSFLVQVDPSKMPPCALGSHGPGP